MFTSRAVAHLRFTGASVLLLLGIAAFPPMLAAQDRPTGWLDRPDKAGADMSDVTFVTMDPGWHITSGPAAIYYNPANTVSGEYSVSSEIFLFDPEGRREAFGVFVGGGDLQEASQRYLYFLIRPTGEFLVKQRIGADTPTLVPWTAHDAIVAWSAREADAETVQNVLAVEAGAETVSFHVNGIEVASLPRAELHVEGVVGLRVNHAVNLHVSSLDVKDHGGER